MVYGICYAAYSGGDNDDDEDDNIICTIPWIPKILRLATEVCEAGDLTLHLYNLHNVYTPVHTV